LAQIEDAGFAHKFDQVDVVPFASGAVAQVHHAVLRDGRRVVVKVLHPLGPSLVSADLRLIRRLAEAIAEAVPESRWISIPEAAQEFSRRMAAHLDLRREARNLRRFRKNFARSSLRDSVRFPEPIAGLESRSVLVEAFEEGTPLAKMLTKAPSAEADQATVQASE
jgi:predicted unusual protein kinase regulating ubiquinone biosynthesis (AarF/ABC1/UbiB family)